MNEENKSMTTDALARLRGVGTGGVKAPLPQAQPATPGVNQGNQSEKQKRDIQELYDFIDAYCKKSEE